MDAAARMGYNYSEAGNEGDMCDRQRVVMHLVVAGGRVVSDLLALPTSLTAFVA